MRALAMRTVCCLLLTTATLVGWCQSPPANALAPPRQITRAEEVLVPSELAGIFRMPPRCDAEGNIYIRKRNNGNEPILKINLKGERKALFQPPIAVGKLGITRDFAISAENEVYLIAYAGRERVIHVFASDGSYKRKITLDAPFLVSPDKLAVFPSGEVLVAGKSNPKTPRTLFTGIFSSSGQLIKELALPDDAELRRLAEKGDRQLSDPAAPGINFAVSRGWAGAGADGKHPAQACPRSARRGRSAASQRRVLVRFCPSGYNRSTHFASGDPVWHAGQAWLFRLWLSRCTRHGRNLRQRHAREAREKLQLAATLIQCATSHRCCSTSCGRCPKVAICTTT